MYIKCFQLISQNVQNSLESFSLAGSPAKNKWSHAILQNEHNLSILALQLIREARSNYGEIENKYV